ncbi:MAG TPA: helix-turn-helix domain-containing protein [Clostridiales bacterium]|nr:helix-turn-helix domain-containing protein [Clostridiales bacterium]HQP69432.1 helix-turn-helix domain-containing protein [Clostridiales bacterium]
MADQAALKYYREYKPDLFWQNYIECFWEFDIEPEILTEANQIYLPDGNSQIIIIIKGSYERYFKDGRREKVNSAVIIPQRTHAVKIDHEPGTKLFGITFKPYGLRCVINEKMSDLGDLSIPLEKKFGSEDAGLLKKAAEEPAESRRLLEIQKILTRHFQALPVRTKIIDIVNFLNLNHAVSISELAKKFSMSTSSLEKLFSGYIGISAKNYMRIIRLNKSVRYFKRHSKYLPNLTATGIEAEFYDQSHFIKDFRQVSGVTPGQYFKENNFFNIFIISSIDKKTDF